MNSTISNFSIPTTTIISSTSSTAAEAEAEAATTINSTSIISTTFTKNSSDNSTSNLLTILSNPIFITFAVIILILAILSMIGTIFRHIREIRRKRLSSMEVQIWEAIMAKSSTINQTYDIEQLVVRQKYIVVPLQCTCEPQVDP